MRILVAAVVLAAGTMLPVTISGQSASQARRLDVAFDATGHVTLTAQNVTVREILAEWGRVGGSRMVNLEKLTGSPLQVPVHFENEPEIAVLQSLLASAAGVIVGPKMADAPGPSRIGTVVIVPTSSPAPSTYVPPPSQNSAVAPPPTTPGSPDDEIPPVRPVANPEPPATQPTNSSPPGVFRPVPIVPIIAAPPAGGTGRGGGGGGGGTTTTTGRGGGGGGGLNRW